MSATRGSGSVAPHWRIWIDTGGTFTDCLAHDPVGEVHRAKVLSSSALRGVIEEPLGGSRLRVREAWGAAPNLVRGFGFRLLAADHPPLPVEGYDPEGGVLRLAGPPPPNAGPGTAFELISPEEAPILAARLVTRTPLDLPLPPIAMRLATTRGTNALLERKGEPAALFITAGFADLLRIGTQQRPDLFALDIRRPEPLYHKVVEVPARLAADGTELIPLDPASLAPIVEELLGQGIRTAAVALMHAFRDPRHEEELEAFLRARGFKHVSRSSELAPFIKLLPRAETATLDAYLAPVLGEYLAGVQGALDGPSPPSPLSQFWERGDSILPSLGAGATAGSAVLPSPLTREGGPGSGQGGKLLVMTSAGGLVRPDSFRAKDGLLSGPAGGVVGAARAGRRSGVERVIAFDMGGTSTDVARWDGDFEYVWEHRVGEGQILAPALAIESVAAGGGSVCVLDANGLAVGPESAGANPGPACYGAGGPLTVTDVNLLLGRLDPACFGIPVDPEAAERALTDVRHALRGQTGEDAPREPLLEGFLDIANERMADAIRGISLRKGYDPADYALVAFGGAGGQHACGVAERLGMRTVIVPPDAGLLSALGIGHAVIERFAERQVLRDWEEAAPAVEQWIEELAARASEDVAAEGVAEEEILVRRRIANLRYRGQESTLPLEYTPDLPLRQAFEQRYQEVYGHRAEERPIELESLRVIASSRPAEEASAPRPTPVPAEPAGRTNAWMRGVWLPVPVFDRAQLPPGSRLAGPAMVWERHSATVLEPGWEGEVDGAGALVLIRKEERGKRKKRNGRGQSAVEAVEEELFTQRFRALVGEMGEQLRRTALSTNVKERLDFSCALLDPGGELVVNAPHIPVHLGALGLCVREVRRVLPLEPGDVVVTNHPAFGGSHLPDITVITPVHGANGALLGYLASRAHHAELGGSRPGSMPPAAHTLAEEGVVLPPIYLVRGGQARWDELRRRLEEGPYPSRAVEDNLADLRAQVAANHRGAQLLRELTEQHGAAALAHYMAALTGRAERRVREALARLPDGSYQAEERLDDG
ncbi:MAG: hydantoinase B/oxoprolinase family protein, partial [Gemmatimonadetes bacterium]|nr:hydantoinase B/oxoprolinase family protein [Gemmatimonadota bacterium]